MLVGTAHGPLGGRNRPGAAVAEDGAASLVTESLLFHKKGETTVKDRRKEQIPDVSFLEFKKTKKSIWLG